MQKTVLIIDDKDRTSVFKSLKTKARSQGLELDLYQYNPGGALENELLDKHTKELNVEKTLEKFYTKFRDIVFDAIACDWNLNVPNINGLDLIRQLSSRGITIRETPKMLYSGTLENELGKMLNNIIGEDDERVRSQKLDTVIRDIKLLVNTDFFAVTGREEIEDDLFPFLLKKEPVEVQIFHILRDNPNLRFSVDCGGKYAGLSFDEVRKRLENDENLLPVLIKDIVEESISFLEHKIAKA